MYQSPIEIIHGELQMQLEGEVYKAVQRVGVTVDKEELLKALQYDREQYKKGYEDGYAKAIEEFAEQMKNVNATNAFVLYHADEIDLAEFIELAVEEIAEQLKGE